MNRLDELIERYIRSAGAVGVVVEPNGAIEILDPVGSSVRAGVVVLCCAAPWHERIARIARERLAGRPGQDVAISMLRVVAREFEIALVNHAVVLERSYHAVCVIDRMIDDARAAGNLKQWTQEFKAAKAEAPNLTYAAFTHAKKLVLAEATATRLRR